MPYDKHEKHGKVAAMPQFNEGHWEKKMEDVNVADCKYSGGEMNQAQEYKSSDDKLAGYVQSHKAQH
jgi:hypothetical protein